MSRKEEWETLNVRGVVFIFVEQSHNSFQLMLINAAYPCVLTCVECVLELYFKYYKYIAHSLLEMCVMTNIYIYIQ